MSHSLSCGLALQRRQAAYAICPSIHNIFTRSLATTTPGPLNDPQTSPSHVPIVNAEQLPYLRRPLRGGQDLSQRYRRLERSLRGKYAYEREIEDLVRTGDIADPAPYTSKEDIQEANTTAEKVIRRVFKGFVVPEAPAPPAEDECCMSGCAVCVYDLYDEARNDYIQAVDNLRSNLHNLGVPESEWPADIRRDWQGGQASPVSKPDVALSAFEQLEQRLKEKREKERPSSLDSLSGRREVPASPPVPRKRPSKKGVGMDNIYEGLRWVLFSNR